MSPGLALQHKGAPQLYSAFAASRFGLVGFNAGDTETISSVLGDFKGVSSSFTCGTEPGAKELQLFDTVVLNLDHCGISSNWLKVLHLADLTRPLVAIGRPEALIHYSAIHTQAAEVVLRPFSIEELVFRLWRGLTRTGRSAAIPEQQEVRQPCILIADDDSAISTLAVRVLAGQGFACHEARNGKQALEFARKLLPDLLILDVNMPHLSGFEVLEILRADPATAAMKIVMFTGSDGRDEVVRGMGLKANAYLCKPFRPFDFLKRIKEILQEPAERRL